MGNPVAAGSGSKWERNLDDVVESLRGLQRRGKACSLLIGAGCSVTANIPTAKGFVDEVAKRYPNAFRRAAEPTYPAVMAQLSYAERRDLIGEFVDDAKINWAHIAIAELMKAGWVDRVLTTNFDPLVVRAAALTGEYPAVYDFAASQAFSAADLPDKAVFHLHGQRTGFAIINTEKETGRLSKAMAPVFADAGRARAWIVAGYSGHNDPVFDDHLATITRFDNRLFWVGYNDADPPAYVREKLLEADKDACFVRGYDADEFFVLLAQRLDCFPPDYLTRPFSHLDRTFDHLVTFRLPLTGSEQDIVKPTRQWLAECREQYEDDPQSVPEAWAAVLRGPGEPEVERDTSDPAVAAATHAGLLQRATSLAREARESNSTEAAVGMLREAEEIYGKALALEPGDHVTLYNWGVALASRARLSEGEEAEALFEAAGRKYAAALEAKPGDADTLYNWANALESLGSLRASPELLRAAEEKYAASAEAQPSTKVFTNWGWALAQRATTQDGQERLDLLREAGEKYRRALEDDPEHALALTNWGVALLRTGRALQGEQPEKAGQAYAQAAEKMQEAERISPGRSAYNLACLAALQGDGNTARGWLAVAQEHGTLPDPAYIAADPDFAKVRDEPWFAEFTGDGSAT